MVSCAIALTYAYCARAYFLRRMTIVCARTIQFDVSMDARLVCPITINAVNAADTPDTILDAFLTSSISVLTASPSLTCTSCALGEVPEAVCLGCTDGSVFVLRASHCGDGSRAAGVLPSLTQPLPPQSALSPKHRAQHLPSSAPTPAGPSKKPSLPYNAPQGLLSAPTRAASNLNTVQVEALKAFVQHDDEEGKLRALLAQSSQQRETSVSNSPSRLLGKSIETGGDAGGDRDGRQKVKHMKSKIIIKPISNDASSPDSGSSSPTSWPHHASLTSPTLRYHLSHHILPSQTGPNHAVVAVRHLVEGRFALILQESGYAMRHVSLMSENLTATTIQ